jgi:hypothetical protein
MRRDTFLKSLLATTAGAGLGAFSLQAQASANLKMMIPANPGGGWDTTGRALGKALQDAGVASAVSFENKGGAAGAIGLAQFVNASKGDGNALMVMGAVMLGGIITGKPPVSVTQATPIARLTSEYNVFVVPAASPFKNMKDVVEALKKDPGSVKWGGGSRGSTEHIAAAMLARDTGVDATKINYVPFRGGGEAVAAILGNNVSVGGSGWSEFADAPEGHRRADDEGAGLQRRDRQLARCLWRARHHAGPAQGAGRHGRQGHQEQVVDRGHGEEPVDLGPPDGQGVRGLRRARVRQPARHHGQGRHDLRPAWPSTLQRSAARR